MNITIKRFSQNLFEYKSYEINENNLLKAFDYIKYNLDSSFSYNCGCRSGVCGSCSIRVNGKEKLACKTKILDGDIIEPLNNLPIVKDLIVDVSHETLIQNRLKISFIKSDINEINQNDIKKIDLQSNCISCNLCYSICPIYEVNKEFIPPFLLTKVYRYIEDKRNKNKVDLLKNVQTNGIWDCTLCGACTTVCPQNIDSKSDILKLQNISVQNGFENPKLNDNTANMNFDNFDGFNPNQF